MSMYEIENPEFFPNGKAMCQGIVLRHALDELEDKFDYVFKNLRPAGFCDNRHVPLSAYVDNIVKLPHDVGHLPLSLDSGFLGSNFTSAPQSSSIAQSVGVMPCGSDARLFSNDSLLNGSRSGIIDENKEGNMPGDVINLDVGNDTDGIDASENFGVATNHSDEE